MDVPLVNQKHTHETFSKSLLQSYKKVLYYLFLILYDKTTRDMDMWTS